MDPMAHGAVGNPLHHHSDPQQQSHQYHQQPSPSPAAFYAGAISSSPSPAAWYAPADPSKQPWAYNEAWPQFAAPYPSPLHHQQQPQHHRFHSQRQQHALNSEPPLVPHWNAYSPVPPALPFSPTFQPQPPSTARPPATRSPHHLPSPARPTPPASDLTSPRSQPSLPATSSSMAAPPLPHTPTDGQPQPQPHSQQQLAQQYAQFQQRQQQHQLLIQQHQQQQQQQLLQQRQQQQQPQPQQQSRNNSNTPLSPPQSPSTAAGDSSAREQARISLLFEINVILLEEVNRLQTLGLGGAISPQHVKQLQAAGLSDKMASEEYIQCLRRVQGNFAYLMPKAQKSANSDNAASSPTTKQILAGPAHVTPPPAAENLDVLREKYEKLRELFPGWQGIDHRLAGGSSASPRPGNGNGNGTPGSGAGV